MIYLKHNAEAQTLYIPKGVREVEGRLFFKAYSTMNLFGFSGEVIDLKSSQSYYRIAIKMPDGVPSGEYEYTLSDSVGGLSTGLLIVGDLDKPIQYQNEIIYEQYN